MEPLVVSLGPLTLQAWGLFMLLALGTGATLFWWGVVHYHLHPEKAMWLFLGALGRRRPRRQVEHDRLSRAAGVLRESPGAGPHRHGLHRRPPRRLPRRPAHGARCRHALPLRPLCPAHSPHAGDRSARQLLRRRCLRHPNRRALGRRPGRRACATPSSSTKPRSISSCSALLLRLRGRFPHREDLFRVYIVGYALIRFPLEYLRYQPTPRDCSG